MAFSISRAYGKIERLSTGEKVALGAGLLYVAGAIYFGVKAANSHQALPAAAFQTAIWPYTSAKALLAKK